MSCWKYLKDPYERRPTLYLDIISWLESKIHNKPVEEIVQCQEESERDSQSFCKKQKSQDRILASKFIHRA